MGKPDGGAAFPRVECVDSDGRTTALNGERHAYLESIGCLSVRDYFAAEAMAAFVRNTQLDSDPPQPVETRAYISRESYAMADAMIAERDKE